MARGAAPHAAARTCGRPRPPRRRCSSRRRPACPPRSRWSWLWAQIRTKRRWRTAPTPRLASLLSDRPSAAQIWAYALCCITLIVHVSACCKSSCNISQQKTRPTAENTAIGHSEARLPRALREVGPLGCGLCVALTTCVRLPACRIVLQDVLLMSCVRWACACARLSVGVPG